MPKVTTTYSKTPIQLDEFLNDYNQFHKKWSPPKVAAALKLTPQAARKRANKAKKQYQIISDDISDE